MGLVFQNAAADVLVLALSGAPSVTAFARCLSSFPFGQI
jgi:hypothetical protein